MTLPAYLENVFAALSHLANALTGGQAMNSFSARTGAAAIQGKRWALVAERVINAVLFSRNHCREHAREEGLVQ